jgi:membrane protease YdiL (CAAX protease family)
MREMLTVLLVWLVFLLSCGLAFPSGNPLVRIPTEILAYSLPLLFIWFLVRGRGFWKSVRVGRKNLGRSIYLSLALLVIFSLVIQAASAATLRLMGKSEEEAKREMENYMENQTPGWYSRYLLFGSFFPVAFCEEAVFRGYVLWTLAPLGPATSILASSVLHLSLHIWYLQVGGIAPLLFVQALLLFVWFGLVSYWSGNIVGTILMHGLVNFLSVLGGFSEAAAGAVQMALICLGAICLFDLLLSHMRLRFKRRVYREMQSQLELNLGRLRQMREGLKKMLAEIRKRYRRGEMGRQDFLRLEAAYKRRIEEVERVLNPQKGPTKSARA